MPEGAGESGNGRSMSEQSSADLSRGLSEHSQSSRGGSSTPRSTKEKLTKVVLPPEAFEVAHDMTEREHICKLTRAETPEQIAVAKQRHKVVTEFEEGKPMVMSRFPQLPKKKNPNHAYGVPVAVSLMLQVAVEGAILFFVLFLIGSTSIYDNTLRSDIRAKCRFAGSTPEGYAVLTQAGLSARRAGFSATYSAADYNRTAGELGFAPEQCGWTGRPIRRFNRSSVEEVYQSSMR